MKAMGSFQKIPGSLIQNFADTQQSGTKSLPVFDPQLIGRFGRQINIAIFFHTYGEKGIHIRTDLRKYGKRGIMQSIVEIEQPDHHPFHQKSF